ncbi:hypothetical protein Mucpa_3045 [Mucilaginibacter paludis DSM 18603]|uniref:Uncharacterized protein n=1 Tax=Mucilaginibacter paludis DSM 18603 TaxID=714943 RepID=H1YDC4_9SPHI|nr:hypothetical protein Mucpa_3045 [Mucilaginibacter paludis DSM 18603]
MTDSASQKNSNDVLNLHDLLRCTGKVRKGQTARRAGFGLWVEGSGSLDFLVTFCVKTKVTALRAAIERADALI